MTPAKPIGRGCPDMADIHSCVICGRDLRPDRQHVDTCGERCFRALLKVQRGQPQDTTTPEKP